jgi:hypothetical protein
MQHNHSVSSELLGESMPSATAEPLSAYIIMHVALQQATSPNLVCNDLLEPRVVKHIAGVRIEYRDKSINTK